MSRSSDLQSFGLRCAPFSKEIDDGELWLPESKAALVADIEHPLGTFRAVTTHLDAHCSRAHRHLQIKIVLDHLDTLPPLPTVIGGDWNEDDLANGATRGPADWLTAAQTVGGTTDGTDRDGTDMLLDGALKGRFERMLFLTATPFQPGWGRALRSGSACGPNSSKAWRDSSTVS